MVNFETVMVSIHVLRLVKLVGNAVHTLKPVIVMVDLVMRVVGMLPW